MSSPGARPHARAAALWMQWVRAAGLMLVVAVPLVVSPWGRDAYSQPKALVLYGVAAAMVVGWVALRITAGRAAWVLTLPELALWAFFLAVLISSSTSVHPRLSFFGAPARYEGLFTVASYLVLFFVGVQFFGSRAHFRPLAVWTCSIAALVTIYGLLQLVVPPLFPGEAFTRAWYGGLGIPRIVSTVGGPIVFGGYLVFVLPLIIALAATGHGVNAAIWLLFACLALMATAFTLTRAAWLAAAVGITTLLIAAGRQVWQRRPEVVVVLAVAVIASAVMLVSVVGTPEQIGSRVAAAANLAGSAAQRLFIWERTLQLIRARPLAGWGLETLGEVFPYNPSDLEAHFGPRPVIIDRAHNDLLQMAVSVGVPGATAYAVFWGLVVVSAVRLWRRSGGGLRLLAAGWLGAIVAYLIQVQFSFSAVALAPIVWLLAGAACGWEAGSTDGRS